MDGGTSAAPVPVFEGKHDLARYPDDLLFMFRAGRLKLWGIEFNVHEPRTYTVGAVKAAAAENGGAGVVAARQRWEGRERKAADNAELEAQVAADLARPDAEPAIRTAEQNQLNPSRTEAIVAMRGNGMTLDAIGKVFDLSRGRIDQILAKAERIEQHRLARAAAAEDHRRLCAEMDAMAAANRVARAKAKRAARVVELHGTVPATNWRSAADEWLAISLERAG
jgi:hypothetical protein